MVETPDGVYLMQVNRGEPPSHRAPDLLSTTRKIISSQDGNVKVESERLVV